MNKNKYIVLALVIIVVLAAYYFASVKSNINTSTNTNGQVNQNLSGQITENENGLNSYKVNEWGVSFSYPSMAQLTELKREPGSFGEARPIGALMGIQINGADFEVILTRDGGGLTEREYTHPNYSISGHTAKTWEYKTEDGFNLRLSLYPECGGLIIKTEGSAASRNTVDAILSSIVCES